MKNKTIYESLQEYLKNTPKEKVIEDWNEFQHLDDEGITVKEFLENQKQETLEEFSRRRFNEQKLDTYTSYNIEDAIKEGAKWQMNKQDNFVVGFAEWSVARALGCDTFTINQGELNIYKKYIDTLNGN